MVHTEYDIILRADLLFLSVRSILSKPSKTNCMEGNETSMNHLWRHKFDLSSYCSEQQQDEEDRRWKIYQTQIINSLKVA